MTGLLTAALVLVSSAWLAGQQVRDARPMSATGRGVISGIVTSAGEPRMPLRQAHVTLVNRELGVSRLVITDDSGAFRFANLPAGRFRLGATKAAYLPTEFGAKRPGGTGISLALADGQSLSGVALVLQRGAVIAGRVVDETGAPAQGQSVVVRATSRAGIPFGGSALTDARGEYRVYGLRPASYRVFVSLAANRALDVLSSAEIDAALRPSSQVGAARQSPTHRTSVVFVPIFHPGTPIEEQAESITVGPGEERLGIDVRLSRVLASQIRGRVIGVDGVPAAGVSVRLLGVNAGPIRATTSSSDPASLGAFLIDGVPPGEFTVIAWRAQGAAEDSPFVADSGPVEVVSGSLALWAAEKISLSGQDIDGLVLALRPGQTIAGRVVFASDSSTPGDVTSWIVNPVGEPVPSGTAIARPPRATLEPDLRFRLEGVMPGRYRLTAGSPADGRRWFVRSILHNGREIGDAWFDLGQEDVSDVVITLTDRVATLTGTLTSAAGQAAPDYFIIAFPADRSRWIPGSARIKAVRPATDGKFTIANVPAGDYLLAAVTDVEQFEWFDSAFLAELVPAAVKVTLVEGETRTQDLRVAGG